MRHSAEERLLFGIGGFELFIILIFGFLIFGPDKLPEIAKTVGKGIARFREAQQEMNEVIGSEKIIDLNNPDEPFKNPVEALDRIAQRQEEKKSGSSSVKSDMTAKGASPAQVDDSEPKQESFTERKARYERERAARKAAEAQAEKAEKAEEPAASQAVDFGENPSPAAQDDNPAPNAADAHDAPAPAPVPAEGGDA